MILKCVAEEAERKKMKCRSCGSFRKLGGSLTRWKI
nr:MAG TPA: Protein of unknown function (DUF3027) [Caudoviricetes sp.]